MAKALSKVRLALGAIFAVVATGLYLFNYFTKPNLGVETGLLLGVIIGALAFLCGWVHGFVLTWILKRLDSRFSHRDYFAK